VRLIREKGELLVAGSEWIGPRTLLQGVSQRKGLPPEVRVIVTGVSVAEEYDRSARYGSGFVHVKEAEGFTSPFNGAMLDAGDFLIGFRHVKEPERIEAPGRTDLWTQRREPLRVLDGGGADNIAF